MPRLIEQRGVQSCDASINMKEYQLAVANWLVHHEDQKGIVVQYGTGTGKTRVAINIGSLFLETGMVDNVVIVAPKAVTSNFEKEIRVCKNISKTQSLPKNYHIYSYDRFATHHSDKSLASALLIVDEAHNLRNIGTARAKSIHKAISESKRTVLLSATPFINNPSDISWAMRLLQADDSGKNFPVTKEAFEQLYDHAPEKYVRNIKNYIAVYHDDPHTTTKPKTTFHEKRVPLNREQAEAIEKVRNTSKFSIKQLDAILKQLQNIEPDQLGDRSSTIANKNWSRINAFLGKVRQISNSVNLKNLCAPKVKELVKVVRKGPKPALIYSQFKKFGIYLVKDCLIEKGVDASKIGIYTGELTLSQRKKLITKYNDGLFDYLLITGSGSEGVDLKGTRQIHVLEPFWNPARIEQVFGRGDRLESHVHLPANERHVDLYMWLGVVDATVLEAEGIDKVTAKEMAEFSPDVRLFEIAKSKNEKIQKYNELNLKASIPTTYEELYLRKKAVPEPNILVGTIDIIKPTKTVMKRLRKLRDSKKSKNAARKSKKTKKTRKSKNAARKSKKSKKSKNAARKSKKSKKSKNAARKSKKSKKSKKTKKTRKSKKSTKPTKTRKSKNAARKSTKTNGTYKGMSCKGMTPPCPSSCTAIRSSTYKRNNKNIHRKSHCRVKRTIK